MSEMKSLISSILDCPRIKEGIAPESLCQGCRAVEAEPGKHLCVPCRQSVHPDYAPLEEYRLTDAEFVASVIDRDPGYGLKKAIVIGRHAGEIPGYEVIETRDVVWPTTSSECVALLATLREDAMSQDAVVILQNTPGQMTAAIAYCRSEEDAAAERNSIGYTPGCGVYVIASKPAAAGDARTFEFGSIDPQAIEQFKAFVAAMMPNATVKDLRCPESGVRVTAEPVRRFEFSHLERLL